jgi:endonuclease YncB( thermonuclease family)
MGRTASALTDDIKASPLLRRRGVLLRAISLDVMNFKRFVIPASTLAFAASLAAFDANAQAMAGAVDCGGSSEGFGEVARVIDGRSFVLADGREIRLAGVETLLPVPGDEDEARREAAQVAKAALETLVLHREVGLRVSAAGADRYGRLVAFVYTRMLSGETLVQGEMVANGQALVSPALPATRCRTHLRDAERDARAHKLGLWGDPYYAVKHADNPVDVLAEQGRFALVEGKVASVRDSGGFMYVNFGRRWSQHFTVAIPKRNEGIFASAGLTPKALAGRNIEVRGWIEERGGPAIEAARPEQIEIVN